MAVLVPIRVSVSTKTVELPLLVVFSVVVLALLGFRERVTRLEGGFLLGGYGLFIYLLLLTRGF